MIEAVRRAPKRDNCFSNLPPAGPPLPIGEARPRGGSAAGCSAKPAGAPGQERQAGAVLKARTVGLAEVFLV